MARSTLSSTTRPAGTGARGDRTEHDAVAVAVAEVCRGRPPELAPNPSARVAFVEAVRRHRVAPLAHVLLRPIDAELAGELKPDRDTAMIRQLSAAVVLDGIGQVLDGIGWAAFKGPMLSEHAHPAPGLRSYNDVDVLVSPHALREVCARLIEAGWRLADYGDMLRNADTPGEMHWVSPSGVLVDLHWSMINMARTRRRLAVETDALLERRTRVQLGQTTAWTISPADTLTHVCLHAALTGADRMLWILDADQLARQTHDWIDVTLRAHEWRAAPALGVVLARARTLLGTPLPPDLHRQLGTPAGFRALTGLADRAVPVPSVRRDASLSRFVARAARPGTGRTLAALSRNSLLWAWHRVRAAERPPEARREPADPEALSAYLDAVEAEANAGPVR